MVQRREKEKDSRYIQKASAPAVKPCIRPVTSCISITLPPLAVLHENQTKAARTSEIRKPRTKDPSGRLIAMMQETPQKPTPSPETQKIQIE
jgi:hypothetical protein